MTFEEFKNEYQKVPVEEYPNQAPENPMVSVCVQTYQHAPYIRECLDSILMQETDFPFEILLGEDESTDGTREICLEYAKKHPDKIRLFLHHRENNIKILGSPTGRFNSRYNFYSSKGKYIALCEGDDYWKDAYKLQKSVDFLENNVNFGLVHGNSDIFYQEKKLWRFNANHNLSNNLEITNKKEQFDRLVEADYKIRTATVLFRKELLERKNTDKMQFPMGDTPLWLDFSQLTKFRYFDEIWSVYRVFRGSASQPKSKEKQLAFKLSSAEMRIYYHLLYDFNLSKNVKNRYNTALINYMIYNSTFEPNYSLFEPTKYEKFKLKHIRFIIIKIMVKFELKLTYYIKAIRHKLTQL